MRPNTRSVADLSIDALLDDHRARWRNGDRRSARDLLADSRAGLSDGAVAELIYQEFELRRADGELIGFDAFVAEYPEHAEALRRFRSADQFVAWFDGDPGPMGEGIEFGGYVLHDRLGEGSSGVVYKAWQAALERWVALKLLRGGPYSSALEQSRFRAEALSMAGLRHANIVAVHEVGQVDGRHFLALEWIDGRTLAAVSAGKPMDPRRAARYALIIARAIAFCHAQGVLHRDLKPSNILLDANDQPRVTDFGLAWRENQGGHLTVTGEVIGTPQYMPPEQARGQWKEVSAASDVYAIGAILYELLTGRPPIQADNLAETIRQVIDVDPARPSLLNRSIPRDLETIAMKCLRKSPKERYSSADAMADDLERYLNGQPIQAKPVSAIEHGWKWTRRHPTLAALIAMLVVSIPSGVIGWLALKHSRAELAIRDQQIESETKLSNTHRYYALVNEAAESAAKRPLGWSFRAVDRLQEAARIDSTEKDRVRLRSLAAEALSAIDVRRIATVAEGINTYCTAFSPDGRLLATGDYMGLGTTSVRVYAVPAFQLVWKLDFASDPKDSRKTGVRALKFSPDGRWLVAGIRNGDLVIWDLRESPPNPIVRPGHAKSVQDLTFGPDLMVSCGQGEAFVVCWDTRSWETIRRVYHPDHQEFRSIQYVESSRTLAASGYGSFILAAEDIQREQGDLAFHRTDSIGWEGLSRDGRLLACRSEFPEIARTLQIAETEGLFQNERKRAFSAQHSSDTKQADELKSVVFSSSASTLWTSCLDRTVKLWEIGSAQLSLTIPVHGNGNVHVALHPDNNLLSVADDNARCSLYEIASQDVLCSLGPTVQPIVNVQISPDGRRLACSSVWPMGFDDLQELAIWDLESGKQLEDRERVDPRMDGSPFFSIWHPTENAIIYGDSPAMTLLYVATGEEAILGESIHVSGAMFTPDCDRIWGISLPESDRVECWRWPSMERTRSWSNAYAMESRRNSMLLSLDISTSWALLGGRDGYTKLLRESDATLVHDWPSEGSAVNAVAISPDERLAVSGIQEGVIEIRRVPDGERVASLHHHFDAVTSVDFNSVGDLLATASKDRTIGLWRVAGDALELLITLPAGGPVRQVRFHPDGRRLAVLVENESAVRLWDLARLNERLTALGIGW